MRAKLFPAASNLATFRANVELLDGDGDGIDLETDVDEITLTLRDPDTGCTEISGSLTGGEITVGGSLDTGVLQVVFSADEMSGVRVKTYEIGLLVEMAAAAGGDTVQAILGRIPVLKGL